MKKQATLEKPGTRTVFDAPKRTRLKPPRNPISQIHRSRIATLMGGLNQADIATMLQISPAHVSLLLNGKRMPSVEIASHLAKILHVTVDDLLDTLAGK